MRVVDVDPWRIMIPGTVRERTRGLLGRDDLGQHEALLLTRCRSVHTFGMRFAIDVVLLDRGMRPVGLVEMRPGRVLLPRLRVRHLLEVAAGRGGAAAHEIHPPAPGTGSVAAESPRPRRPS